MGDSTIKKTETLHFDHTRTCLCFAKYLAPNKINMVPTILIIMAATSTPVRFPIFCVEGKKNARKAKDFFFVCAGAEYRRFEFTGRAWCFFSCEGTVQAGTGQCNLHLPI
jgi:DeoR/GlpR family transcriptional regulator of sugar metabolism